MNYPITPTVFKNNPFEWDWVEKDFFHSADGSKEFPNHHCKQTWVKSYPYIKGKRNAVDVGCRDGEYSRYLHTTFEHVYCFDYRRRKLFNKNVDVSKITHFKCGLGETQKKELVSGGGSMTTGKIPKDKWYYENIYTLDEFKLTNIDYIKIDVDGYETKVLQGAINTINKYNPLLVIEQEGKDTEAIDFCKEIGYSIVEWDDAHRNVIMEK
jgi:hypothetical protein